MAVQSLSWGGGGWDTLRSEALLKVWPRNFSQWPVAEITFCFCQNLMIKPAHLLSSFTCSYKHGHW